MKADLKMDVRSQNDDSNARPLTGNDAVAQGILDSGVGMATGYPGTPSTEIQKSLYKSAREGRLYFEYAVNEKVALEIAFAAALSGIRSATIMKHVGLNVASDALMAMTYMGVPAGMVVVVADDPGCLSSQNEQDSRIWGHLAHVPIFEPSTSQEARDMFIQAMALSEKHGLICLFRLTNLTALNTSVVRYHSAKSGEQKSGEKGSGEKGSGKNWTGRFIRDVRHAIPARYIHHRDLHDKLDLLSDDADFLSLNYFGQKSRRETKNCILTHNSIFPIVKYMAELRQLQLSIFTFGALYPINERQLLEDLSGFKTLYIIEELETYLETHILAVLAKQGQKQKVLGKKELAIPRENRIVPDTLTQAFERIRADMENRELPRQQKGQSKFEPVLNREELLLPRTLPKLCNGCPHRGAFYTIKKTIRFGDICPSDIGCYALGQVPPIEVGDFWLCMGASIGTAIGFSVTNKKKVIAIIGDGTFFHAGLPALVDAVTYGHNITVAILNNRLTAMTGGQPNPGGELNIERVVKGLGVKWVRSVNAFDPEENIPVMKEAVAYKGPSVVVFNGECLIETTRTGKIVENRENRPVVDNDLCTDCGKCLFDLSCPSLVKTDGRIQIDDSCMGCSLCIRICPQNAIHTQKEIA